MYRAFAAVVMICLYCAGAICVVRNEGQQYRRTHTAGKPVASASLPTSAASPAKVPEKPDPPPATTNLPPVVASADKGKLRTPEATPQPSHSSVSVPAPLPDPALVPDPIWNSPQVKKSWDLANLKPADRGQIGHDLNQLIEKFNPVYNDDKLQLRANRVLTRLCDAASPKEARFQLRILDSDQVNAFSHPGGYIYITRGLLNSIGDDEDYMLEFAIGHEMAHVELNHALICLTDPEVMSRNDGTVEKLYLVIIPNGFIDKEPGAKNQEFNADEWIYKLMTKLHRTNYRCLKFLYRLKEYATEKRFASGDKRAVPSKEESPVSNHYRAHLATEDRINHLLKFRDQLSTRPK
jgi:Peptidase family M48